MPEYQTGEAPTEESARDWLSRDPASRKRFLALAGGAGAAGAFSALLAACGGGGDNGSKSGGSSSKKSSGGDIAIVNYALTLEYLEAQFYADVVKSGLFKGKQLDLLKTIGEHERQHVNALNAAVSKLGGKPAAKPKAKFPLKDPTSVAKLAATVENLGAAAYLGQAGRIKNPEILAAALSIHTVEARHAAVLNTLVGKPVTPDGAFAKPASMAQVLPKVKPFIAS